MPITINLLKIYCIPGSKSKKLSFTPGAKIFSFPPPFCVLPLMKNSFLTKNRFGQTLMAYISINIEVVTEIISIKFWVRLSKKNRKQFSKIFKKKIGVSTVGEKLLFLVKSFSGRSGNILKRPRNPRSLRTLVKTSLPKPVLYHLNIEKVKFYQNCLFSSWYEMWK